MKHSAFKTFSALVALGLLVIGFQNCANTGTASSASTSDQAVIEAYPSIHSVEPSGNFHIDGNWLRCSGECTINFHPTTPGLGSISSVNCEGDLTISDSQIRCSNNLSVSDAD